MLKGYLIFILVLFADTAAASSAGPGGSGMQWETGLQMIVRSVTGPVAYAFAAGGVVALGIRLAGGTDMDDFTKRVLNAVMGLSLIMFSIPLLGTLFAGAVIS